MTIDRRYRPTNDEREEFARRLREVIDWALRELAEQSGHQVALATAALLDRGKWRLMTSVDADRNGEPLPETLWYRVEVEVSNGWVELVEARWSALGVSEESARDEARWTALQNGLGVPDDLSGLDSPST